MRLLTYIALSAGMMLSSSCAVGDTGKTTVVLHETMWLTDSARDCKFQTVKVREGLLATGTWSGECKDGLANGIGTATLNIRYTPDAIEKTRERKPSLANTLSHLPPSKIKFIGSFRDGVPCDQIVVELPSSVSMIAMYKEGAITGEVIGQWPTEYASDLKPSWFHLTREQFEKVIAKGGVVIDMGAKPIDPHEKRADPRVRLSHDDKINFTKIFDIAAYNDIGLFRETINDLFPIYSKQEKLLSYLIGEQDQDLWSIYADHTERAFCKYGIGFITPDFPTIWHCVSSSRRDAGNGNEDDMVFAALITDDATLLLSETHLFMHGPNFKSRGIPLLARNFATSEDFIEAAKQLLNEDPNPESIADLMKSAGLEGQIEPARCLPMPPVQPGKPTTERQPIPQCGDTIKVHYAIDNNGYWSARAVCNLLIGAEWFFDGDTRKLLRVQPLSYSICL